MIRLYEGDCLEIMPQLAENSVDAVITDPPYGTTACKWDTVIPFARMWGELERLCHGMIILHAAQPFASALVMSNVKNFKYELVWKKRRLTGYLDARRRPLRTHELILVFESGQSVYNPQMTKGRVHKRGARPRYGGQARCYGRHERNLTLSNEWYPRDVIEFAADRETTVTLKDRPNKRPRHPTQKPVALEAYLVNTYSNPGDMVLDFTMGSGTTGVACVRTGRDFVGIEIDPDYFAIAGERVAEAQLQPRLQLESKTAVVQSALEGLTGNGA